VTAAAAALQVSWPTLFAWQSASGSNAPGPTSDASSSSPPKQPIGEWGRPYSAESFKKNTSDSEVQVQAESRLTNTTGQSDSGSEATGPTSDTSSSSPTKRASGLWFRPGFLESFGKGT
jgi:hypothetical protein